ncbi:hypothetical protein LTR64_000108 [Lithohypha guttulata]|uniref:uncharacterized protein n=1 Tax=Lithohypha guttulata TaxID=1690604 RepID=UPI002DE0F527|nr:hypothetical protein LTR51_007470 [Lithohypha guttulata]
MSKQNKTTMITVANWNRYEITFEGEPGAAKEVVVQIAKQVLTASPDFLSFEISPFIRAALRTFATSTLSFFRGSGRGVNNVMYQVWDAVRANIPVSIDQLEYQLLKFYPKSQGLKGKSSATPWVMPELINGFEKHIPAAGHNICDELDIDINKRSNPFLPAEDQVIFLVATQYVQGIHYGRWSRIAIASKVAWHLAGATLNAFRLRSANLAKSASLLRQYKKQYKDEYLVAISETAAGEDTAKKSSVEKKSKAKKEKEGVASVDEYDIRNGNDSGS